jgi:DNA-binding MarR family transcriptional regulator
MSYAFRMSNKKPQSPEAELLLTLGLLVRKLRAQSRSQTQELSLTQMAVIARLAKEGPMTTADLARAESVKPQSMGTAVAALENMGLIGRERHPSDGRQVFIALTVKGKAMRESARDAKRTWLEQAIGTLDKHEKEVLFAAGDVIRRLVES